MVSFGFIYFFSLINYVCITKLDSADVGSHCADICKPHIYTTETLLTTSIYWDSNNAKKNIPHISTIYYVYNSIIPT